MEDGSKSGAAWDLGYIYEGTTIAKIGTENRIINSRKLFVMIKIANMYYSIESP